MTPCISTQTAALPRLKFCRAVAVCLVYGSVFCILLLKRHQCIHGTWGEERRGKFHSSSSGCSMWTTTPIWAFWGVGAMSASPWPCCQQNSNGKITFCSYQWMRRSWKVMPRIRWKNAGNKSHQIVLFLWHPEGKSPPKLCLKIVERCQPFQLFGYDLA